MTGEPLIDVRNLSIRYATERGVVSAVDDVSFTIDKGVSLGLVGESGSGKSTIGLAILRLLAGNALIDGDISYEQTPLLELPEQEMSALWRWQKISMVFQKSLSALSPVHHIGEQMRDVLHIHEPHLSAQEREERIADVMGGVRLPDRVLDSYPFELSGGMMQRTMIALSLICKPSFVIFDEATTALDVITQSQILSEMNSLKRDFDLTTLVISHDVGVINAVTDVVAVLYAGQLMEVAPRERFFNAPIHPYSQALTSSVPRLSGPKRRLAGIPGSLPDLSRPPSGCRFAPRCPHATPACMESAPPLIEVAPGHLVRCTEFSMKEDSAA